MGSLVISCRIEWVSQMNTMRGRKYKADDHLVRVNSEAFCSYIQAAGESCKAKQ